MWYEPLSNAPPIFTAQVSISNWGNSTFLKKVGASSSKELAFKLVRIVSSLSAVQWP